MPPLSKVVLIILMTLPPAAIAAARRQAEPEGVSFLCMITSLRSCGYGGLYGGLYERAHIIRCFTARRQAEPEGVAEGRVGVRPQRLEP
jgi:hypothetical protein